MSFLSCKNGPSGGSADIISTPGSVVGYLLGGVGILSTVTTQISITQNGSFVWNVDGYSQLVRTKSGGIVMTSADGVTWARDDSTLTTSLVGKKYLFYVQTTTAALTLTIS